MNMKSNTLDQTPTNNRNESLYLSSLLAYKEMTSPYRHIYYSFKYNCEPIACIPTLKNSSLRRVNIPLYRRYNKFTYGMSIHRDDLFIHSLSHNSKYHNIAKYRTILTLAVCVFRKRTRVANKWINNYLKRDKRRKNKC